ncbi:MAG: hypothetical protein JW969_01005 [Spirochaetales bacterium]|nr:hypothetical protein [Spirochaetales bacterium]
MKKGWKALPRFSIWEKEEYVLDTVPVTERNEITRELKNIMERNGDKSEIVWKMRRIVLKKQKIH